MDVNSVYLSVVIPVYNEQECLERLYKRLIAVCENTQKSYEIIFANDGSKDNTSKMLKKFYEKRPDVIRVIEFSRNFGQHQAIIAAFGYVKGEVIINMDADMQNPPEEIFKLLQKIEEGYDYVGSIRDKRIDNYLLRNLPSRIMNFLRKKITGIQITDQGCMFRAYSRQIVDLIASCNEASTFVTVLGESFANNPVEIRIAHQARHEGKSKYSFYKLFQVSLDLFTSFSLVPIHIFTILGIFASISSSILLIFLILKLIFFGLNSENLSIFNAIIIFLISLVLTGIGIVGEYVGRIYHAVRNRPRFLIKKTYGI